MKRKLTFTYLLGILFTIFGCVEEEQFADTAAGNVEALWKIMDEHYCFFDYKKQQLGVDWDDVHVRYSAQASQKLSNYQQFELMKNMIGELRDGHVNLMTAFDLGRNWSWKEDYPTNFSDTLQRKYLGTDYRISNGIFYRILDDNIGYIYCGTFENDFGSGNLENIIYYLTTCNGLIIDVRNNSGGQLTAAETLAERFINKETLVGYMCHKTGKGHNDFSKPQEQILKPALGMRWQKPVCVLTNRSVFSAANEFVKYMRAAGIKTVGDQTGGGAGMPFSSELPNGWAVRFSACPMYDKNMVSTEQGIAPDYPVAITDADFAKGKDTILEFARQLLKKQQ